MKLTIARSITITAPIKEVKALVLDFKHWGDWSPWTVLEADCKVVISGNPDESGYTMRWDGEMIGSGKNTLTAVQSDYIQYDLEFLKPWKSSAKITFSFSSTETGTKVTWAMNSSMPFFMFFMIPMLKVMLSMDFDRGLKMLRAVAEEGRVSAQTISNDVVEFSGFSFIGVQRTVHFDKLGEVIQKDFDTLLSDVVQKQKISAKHWVCLYPKMDMAKMMMTYIAAISDEEVSRHDVDGTYVTGQIPSGKMLEISHHGRYDFLGNAWSMGMMIIRAKKLKQSGVPFEYYWNNPHEVSPENLQTSVYLPLK